MWHDYKTDPPPVEVCVLGFNAKMRARGAWLDYCFVVGHRDDWDGDRWYAAYDDDDKPDEPTHWMDLPATPPPALLPIEEHDPLDDFEGER